MQEDAWKSAAHSPYLLEPMFAMDPTVLPRRRFLKSTAAVLGGMTLAGFDPSARAQGVRSSSSSERPRVGCIGVGSRGRTIARQAARLGDVVAVCDADLAHANKAKRILGGKPEVYRDYRRLLDRRDIDVVLNATPDHWHTLINVLACRAGKDVYTEKPLTLTIDEGKTLREVVKETGRVVQVGTHQRSISHIQRAVELVRNGRIGKLKQVWVVLPYFSTRGGPFSKEPVPKQLDWDLYQGQTPKHDYCRQRTHRFFRWWYEYAGGIVTDWGNHHIDIAHWGMDCELGGPASVEARGLFPNENRADCFNTADRFFARLLYPSGVELFYFSAIGDQRRFDGLDTHVATSPEQTAWLFGDDVPEEIKTFRRNGTMFIGDKGRIFANRGGLYGKPVDELKENPLPADAWRITHGTNHMGNFFECVKTRQEPASPVRIQHRAVTVCHLTNISMRLGRKLTWDPLKEEIVGDEQARAWQARPQRKPYVITV